MDKSQKHGWVKEIKGIVWAHLYKDWKQAKMKQL